MTVELYPHQRFGLLRSRVRSDSKTNDQGSAPRIDLATNLIYEMSARELSQIKRFLAIFDRAQCQQGSSKSLSCSARSPHRGLLSRRMDAALWVLRSRIAISSSAFLNSQAAKEIAQERR